MTYLTEVVADNPLHYWRCADQSGSILNDIGSTPHAMHVVTGLQSIGYSGPNSDGGSCDLALVGNYANTGEVVAWAGGALTLEIIAWSWQSKAAGNQWLRWDVAGAQYAIYNDGVNWRGVYNNTLFPAAGVTAVVDQAWTHLLAAYGAGTAQLYVNGAASGAALAIAAGGAGNALLNVLQTFANNSRGFVSEIAVYASKLSAARAAAHYAAIDQIGQPPVAGGAGSLGGQSTNPLYSGILQEILSSVRKTFPTT